MPRLAEWPSVRTLAWITILGAACLVLGAVVVTTHRLPIAFAAGGVVILVASLWPRVFVPGLVLLLLVPYTWSPTVNGTPEPVVALVALAGALVAVTRLIVSGGFRANRLDYLVLAIVVSAVLSEVHAQTGSLGSDTVSRTDLNVMLLPYLAFRTIFTVWPNAARRVPDALVMTGCVLSAVAIFEELKGRVLVAGSSLNNPLLSRWALSYQRGHGLRAEATMGHPLAFGCFLVIPLVFAFYERRWSAVGLLAVGEALTLSRGPYIAALVALVLCAVLTKRAGRLTVVVVVVASLALFVGPVRNSVTDSFQAGTIEQSNANYRAALLSTSLGTLTVWGDPLKNASELYGQSGQFELRDITSEVALLAGRQGAVGLSLWMAVLAAFVYVIGVGRRCRDDILMLLGVALIGEWVALLSVSLITSFQDAFWLTVALASARLATRAVAPAVQSPALLIG